MLANKNAWRHEDEDQNIIAPKRSHLGYAYLENQYEDLARKARAHYVRKNYLPSEVPGFETLRLRQPEDSIDKLKKEGCTALSILKRDEFSEDIDCVIKMSDARKII